MLFFATTCKFERPLLAVKVFQNSGACKEMAIFLYRLLNRESGSFHRTS
jgi:hypothetical protein